MNKKTNDKNFDLDPFLQVNFDSSLTIMWRSASNGLGWVGFAHDSLVNQKIYRVIDGIRIANTICHRIDLQKDLVNKLFFYRANFEPTLKFTPYTKEFGQTSSSEIFECKPLPKKHQEVKISIFNDLHNKPEILEQLVKNSSGFEADFTIFNGDCFADLTTEEQLLELLRKYNKTVKATSKPVLYLRGNHEIRGDNAKNMRKWINPHEAQKFYGAFSAGPIRFVILDSGEDKSDDHIEYSNMTDFATYRQEQVAFLEKELNSEEFLSAPYKILLHHIPLYNKDDFRISLAKELWEPILKDANFSVAICGHTHNAAFFAKDRIGNPCPVFIGGGPSEEKATIINIDANKHKLKVSMLDCKGLELSSLTLNAGPFNLI